MESPSNNVQNLVYMTGAATVILASVLAFMLKSKKDIPETRSSEIIQVAEEVPELDKEKYPGGYLTIFFGSQTGTAESFSNDIKRESASKGFKAEVVDLEEIEDDIEGHILNESKRDDNGKNRAIFVMATYGEGEATDNAAQFVRFLKAKSGLGELDSPDSSHGEEKKAEESEYNNENLFKGLDFAVFGLGDKQYDHFCATGKFVNKALEKIGGKRVVAIGVGDDQADIEADFETWKDNVLWPALKKSYIGEDVKVVKDSGGTKKSKSMKLPACQYAVEYLEQVEKPDDTPIENIHLSSKHYFDADDCPVTEKRELRSSSDPGSTLHMEIDISQTKSLKYQTADNLGILPMNDTEIVEGVSKALNYDLNAYFRVIPAPGKQSKHTIPFPTPCSIGEFLTRYCDLTGSPRRSDLKQLAAYAKSRTCKDALLRMASKEGKAEYKEKVVDAKIGIADIITKLCPSIEMPLEHFIAACPRLLPRYYTISSSSSVHPESIHVTVSVILSERADKSMFKGVCSNHLADTAKSGTIRAFTRPSTFRLPSDSSKPIIMVGPGTGIAPMRALIQERLHQKETLNLDVGKNVLYFGCKQRSQDFLYEDELKKYEESGILTNVHLAFSREKKDKVYVQHLLAENGDETWDLIEKEGAYVYVCGGVMMGHDVSEVLKSIISKHGDRSADESKAYLDQMASKGRFVQELWA